MALKEGRRRHNLSGLTVAALGDILLAPGDLEGMSALSREPLNGGDLGAAYIRGRDHTGSSRIPVNEHGAGATLRDTATVFGARQAEVIPQEPEQRRIRLSLFGGYPLPIDSKLDHLPVRQGLSVVKRAKEESAISLLTKTRRHGVIGSKRTIEYFGRFHLSSVVILILLNCDNVDVRFYDEARDNAYDEVSPMGIPSPSPQFSQSA